MSTRFRVALGVLFALSGLVCLVMGLSTSTNLSGVVLNAQAVGDLPDQAQVHFEAKVSLNNTLLENDIVIGCIQVLKGGSKNRSWEVEPGGALQQSFDVTTTDDLKVKVHSAPACPHGNPREIALGDNRRILAIGPGDSVVLEGKLVASKPAVLQAEGVFAGTLEDHLGTQTTRVWGLTLAGAAMVVLSLWLFYSKREEGETA